MFTCCILCLLSCQSEKETPAFKTTNSNSSSYIKLSVQSPSHTKVNFNNKIQENERLHIFIWNFLYQGAGVGIGDINNDGLPDVYFCGNMVSDKLYINKGNFIFEDISFSSGISDKLWSTGVTMVDINNDGLLDIYVCKNFFLLQENVRKNKLFINNGDLTFTESAKEYGLDDTGYSISANFFDADNDSDLDMYLVNQPMDVYASQLAKPETLKKLPFSDKMFINENGKYIDRTDQLNMTNRSYGLSAITADLTHDGWTDLYVCNDYNKGDLFYVNKKDLHFKNEITQRLDHTSFYSMGSDCADINNDGLLDFISLDMAFNSHYQSKTNMESMRPELFWDLVSQGNHYQYPTNSLQINMGEGRFTDIAHMSSVSHTNWSWSPLFIDLDSDGLKDLLVTNGLLKDLRNNDFSAFLKQNSKNNDYRALLASVPSTPVNNFLFRNENGFNLRTLVKYQALTKLAFHQVWHTAISIMMVIWTL